ncbi:ComEC/Rec2 family competence protein [Hydrogenoanaerobacterium sp.]|uniref:ComEC/Rec2 family competence protein n=1 Tax=Hydrogenoanaerobacterium sp. TaxID=2953763 RepID=UPI0028A12E03|nr:ComEC/Rec2 family competence protein [Hydrogenoanaerobacterium sp.]
MKRPIAVIGLTYLFTAAVAVCFSWTISFAAGIAMGLCGLLALLSRHPMKRCVSMVLLTASVACIAVMLFTLWRIEPQRKLAGKTVPVSGTVTRVVGERSIELELANGTVMAVSSRETLDTDLGDRFSATVTLSLYESGSTSLYAQRKAKTVPLRGFVLGDYITAPPQGNLRGWLNQQKQAMSNQLRRMLPKTEGNVLAGMLLGQQHLIPQETRDDYAAAGISHIIAISGFHIAVISAFFQMVFQRLRLGHKLSTILTAAAILLYMALVGYTPSVVRAGVMVILHLVAQLVWRKADSLTSLAVAGLFICVPNPLAAGDISFQLTFLATLGMVLCSSKLYGAIQKRLGRARFPKTQEFAVSSLAMTLCATLFTLPVIVFSFGRVSLYAPLTNLLIAPLIPLSLVLGLCAAVLSAVPLISVAAVPFAFLAGIAIKIISSVSAMMAALPFAQLPVGAGFVPVWMLGAAVLIALAMIRPTRKKTIVCGALCAISLMVGIFSYQLLLRGTVRATTLVTENSVIFVVVKDRRAAVLGDINSKNDAYRVQSVLERYSIDSIDLLALQPTTRRRNSAAGSLLERYQVGTAVLSMEDYQDERLAQAVQKAGAVYEWGDMQVSLLSGGKVQLYQNDISAEFNGIKTFILTGECDILSSSRRFGDCAIAVLAGDTPQGISRLRCDTLVTNRIYSGEVHTGLAVSAYVLDDDKSEISWMIKDGKLKVLAG